MLFGEHMLRVGKKNLKEKRMLQRLSRDTYSLSRYLVLRMKTRSHGMSSGGLWMTAERFCGTGEPLTIADVDVHSDSLLG